MAKSLDDLLEFLLEEIALSGERGRSLAEVIFSVSAFYKPLITTSYASHDDDAGSDQRSWDQNSLACDQKLIGHVWKWLGRHPDVSIGQDAQFNTVPLVEVEVTDPQYVSRSFQEALRLLRAATAEDAVQTEDNEHLPSIADASAMEPRIYVTEERMFLAICGHLPDPTKVFPMEWRLLSHIATTRRTGILQGELGRVTGQDKRSVPKRTDTLQAKGYIVKKTVYVKGNKTSRLFLRRFITEKVDGTIPQDQLQPWQVEKLTAKYQSRQLFEILKSNPLITQDDLAEALSMTSSGKDKVFSIMVRHFGRVGCIKRIRTTFGPLAEEGDLMVCVQYLREPQEADWIDQSEDGIDFNMSVEELAAPYANHDRGQHDQDEENNAADVEIVSDAALRSQRVVPIWNPDRVLANAALEVVKQLGPNGVKQLDIRRLLIGSFVRRVLDSLLIKLSHHTLESQPIDLKHLSIVRAREARDAVYQFVYYHYSAFEDRVHQGTATWQDLDGGLEFIQKCGLGPSTILSQVHFERDQFGFPRRALSNAQPRAGRVLQIELVQKAQAKDKRYQSAKDESRPSQWQSFAVKAIQPSQQTMTPKSMVSEPVSDNSTPKRKRGRPKKNTNKEITDQSGEAGNAAGGKSKRSTITNAGRGRPRKFFPGTEDFWKYMINIASHQVDVEHDQTQGIEETRIEPAGKVLFRDRPPKFDEVLVRAIDAGLPVPQTPQGITEDWITDTIAALELPKNGLYFTQTGILSHSRRQISKIMVLKTPRLKEIDFSEKKKLWDWQLLVSSAAHSFRHKSLFSKPKPTMGAPKDSTTASHKSEQAFVSQTDDPSPIADRYGEVEENTRLQDFQPDRTLGYAATLTQTSDHRYDPDTESTIEHTKALAAGAQAQSPAEVSDLFLVNQNKITKNATEKMKVLQPSMSTRSTRVRKLTRKAAENISTNQFAQPIHQEISISPFEEAQPHVIGMEAEQIPVLEDHQQVVQVPTDPLEQQQQQVIQNVQVTPPPDAVEERPNDTGEIEKDQQTTPNDLVSAPVNAHTTNTLAENSHAEPSSHPYDQPGQANDIHLDDLQQLTNASLASSALPVLPATPTSPALPQVLPQPPTTLAAPFISLQRVRERQSSEDAEASRPAKRLKTTAPKPKARRSEASKMCRSIIIDLVNLCNGLAPSDPWTFRRAIMTRWTESGIAAEQPTARSVKRQMRILTNGTKVKQITFAFRSRMGAMLTKSIIALRKFDGSSPEVLQLQKKMTEADKEDYVPPELVAEFDRVATAIRVVRPLDDGSDGDREDDDEDSAANSGPSTVAPSPRTPKTRPLQQLHRSPSSEAAPIVCGVNTGFLTLKVPKLHTLNLPTTRKVSNTLTATPVLRVENTNDAATPTRAAVERPLQRDLRQNRKTRFDVETHRVIWINENISSLPKSLDDIPGLKLSRDRAVLSSQGNNKHCQFFADIDHVADWELRSAEFANHRLHGYEFINHIIPQNAAADIPYANNVELKRIIIYNNSGQEAETVFPNEVSWPPFASALNNLKAADQPQLHPPPRQKRKYTKRKRVDPGNENVDSDFVDDEATAAAVRVKRRRTRIRGRGGRPSGLNYRPKERGIDNRKTRQLRRPVQVVRYMPHEMQYRVVVVVVTIRTLVGGVEKFIDWQLVNRVFPGQDEEHLQSAWKSLLNRYRADVNGLTESLQEKYLDALAAGQVPSVNFDDLRATDWEGIVDWAMVNLERFQISKVDELPSTRERFARLNDYTVTEPRAIRSMLNFGIHVTIPRREEIMASTVFGTNLIETSKLSPASLLHHLQEFTEPVDLVRAKSWVLSLLLTPEEVYDPKRAHRSLLNLAPTPDSCELLVDEALSSLQRSRWISRTNNAAKTPATVTSTDINGVRTWQISSKYYEQFNFRRQITGSMLKTAARYKIEVLDKAFSCDMPVIIGSDFMSDAGEMVAIINLMSMGAVRVTPGKDLPDTRYGLDWENQGYSTRLIDKATMGFGVVLQPVPYAYEYGNPLYDERENSVVKIPRGELPDDPDNFENDTNESKLGRIPPWFDINIHLQSELWEMFMGTIVGLISIRPGASIEELRRSIGEALTCWEISLIVDYLLELGAIKKTSSGMGYESEAWWWMSIPPASASHVTAV